MKKFSDKGLCLILAMCLVLLYIPIDVAKAKGSSLTAEHTFLVYSQPFKTNIFNNFGITNLTNAPEYLEEAIAEQTADIKEKYKWKVLQGYDKLTPGEIHRRVQDDIWFRSRSNDNNVNEGECTLDFIMCC